MADEQVVHFLCIGVAHIVSHSFRRVGDLAQGGAQQVIPQLPLDPDGLQPGVLLVQGLQCRDVPLVGGAVRAEVLRDAFLVRADVFPDTSAVSRSHS